MGKFLIRKILRSNKFKERVSKTDKVGIKMLYECITTRKANKLLGSDQGTATEGKMSSEESTCYQVYNHHIVA